MPEWSPERVKALSEASLRYEVGINPDSMTAVLDLAAVGLVYLVWRNSPIEDWHSGRSPLHDEDMLRINAHTTWRVRQLLRRWRSDYLPPKAPSAVLDTLDNEATDRLGIRLFTWLVNPRRRLPTDMTLAELASLTDGDLNEFEDHADRALSAFIGQCADSGALSALWQIAAAGGRSCTHWWGTPTWPGIVTTFIQTLDEPHHDHWAHGHPKASLRPEPTPMTDRRKLRRTLLSHPWTLDSDTARWIIDAGIGFLRQPLPKIPDHVLNHLDNDDHWPSAATNADA